MTRAPGAQAPRAGVFQFVFDQSLSRDPRIAGLFRLLSGRAARVHDALVTYQLNGRPLALPLSHDLPTNRRTAPIYSDNLRRLAAFVRRRHGHLCMIDVGANIGDSWALAGSEPGDSFLLIEASERWFRLLEHNTGDAPGVERVRCLLSDRSEERAVRVQVEAGNARVIPGEAEAPLVALRTLDDLLAEHVKFRAANLLKVDVEGWDARVLRGARELLVSAGPALLFEHQPQLLAGSGEDPHAIVGWLEALGYRQLILYDNRGILAAVVGMEDRARLDDLFDYAGRQEGYYYDVCTFREPDTGEEFLADERAFYAARQP